LFRFNQAMAKIPMAEFEARTVGDRVELALSDDSGKTTTFLADRYQIFAILVLLTDAIRSLPGDSGDELHGQHPVMRASDPSFHVGVSPNGEAVLVIRPDPLPPIEFYFSADRLNKMIADLKDVAAIPEHSRSHKKPQ
jgi:hypothetical protein